MNSLAPALRLSLAPDGKSVTYSTVKRTANLWLAEGLDAVRHRCARPLLAVRASLGVPLTLPEQPA